MRCFSNQSGQGERTIPTALLPAEILLAQRRAMIRTVNLLADEKNAPPTDRSAVSLPRPNCSLARRRSEGTDMRIAHTDLRSVFTSIL